MSGAQRLIKYCAVAFAVFLMFVIGSGVLMGVSALVLVFQGDTWQWNVNDEDMELIESTIDAQVRTLDINVKATAVQIRTVQGDEAVRVETDNEHIETWVNNGELHVVEKSHGFFGWGGTGRLVLYVRDDMVFDDVQIAVGAGGLNIEELVTEKLDLELGAGRVAIGRLYVSEKARIDGGAGTIEITEGNVNGLDMELGAGKMSARLKLGGTCEVDSGVGRLELELVGSSDDYRIELDKGIGSVTLDGRDLDDGAVWGEGATRVHIDTGIGAVEIRTTR